MINLKFKDEVESFNKYFNKFKNVRIALYGIGRMTSVILTELGMQYNFVALLDKDPENIGRNIRGVPIVSVENVEKVADIIIINTHRNYWNIIFHRIRDVKIPVYYLDGTIARTEVLEESSGNEYWQKDVKDLEREVENYDIVTFDLFDTLIARSILIPDDVQNLSSDRLNDITDSLGNFYDERKRADSLLSNKYINIDEIYDIIWNKNSYSEELKEMAKRIELDVERVVSYPRADMVKLCNRISEEKEVYIISDMYLPTSFLKELCYKAGISENIPLMISNELKHSKKDGSLWEQFVKEHEKSQIIHIGDDVIGDIEQPKRYGIATAYVASPNKIWEMSSMKELLVRVQTKAESVFAGLLCKRLFADAFGLVATRGKVILKSYEDIGYVLFGSMMYTFLEWIDEQTKKQNINRIFFMARDGYWLIEDYNYLKSVACKKIYTQAQYLPVSREVLLIADCDSDKEWSPLLEHPYSGRFCDYVKSRLHYSLPENDEHSDEWIVLPSEISKIKEWLRPYIDMIFPGLSKEANEFKEYLNELHLCKDDALVDLWYAGSSQKLLSKILGIDLQGFYMVVRKQASDNDMHACFQKNNDYKGEDSYIRKQSIFVESFLTAPYGMIKSIKQDGTFMTEPKMTNQKEWNARIRINNGIKEFIKDYEKLGNRWIDTDFINELWKQFYLGNIEIEEQLKSAFYYDNILSKVQEYPVFE
ncbi:hypothetical protein [Butyrivibrio sp. FC2001]|uniref:hypothetical protein n=1 Tax=Butyrivibrio sp. FC2001 TaxID=1280671 RepID=UPI00041C280D|nr:hypothetical protein [Butyrivibrio sp. FC2001]